MNHAQRTRLCHHCEVCLSHGPQSVPMLIGECKRLEQWLPTIDQIQEAMAHLITVGRAEAFDGGWRLPGTVPMEGKEPEKAVESHGEFAARRTRELGWGG